MIHRWWKHLAEELNEVCSINKHIGINEIKVRYKNFNTGTLSVGKDTFISEDAKLNGNIIIGNNCMIGTNVIIRGNVKIYNNVKIGYGVEIKDSVIKENTCIGPLCYLGNSLVDNDVYLGALVRTSNHRLDRAIIKSWNGENYEDTGFEKLGSWIKEKSNLGVGVVILPGRIVPENSIFSPNIVITKNYIPGTYKATQNITAI